MKKAALTFGLFSLIMVATSFATPEKTSRLYSDNTIDIGIGTDGSGDQQGIGKRRKTDDFMSENHSNSSYNQLNDMSVNSQSTRLIKKLD